MISRRSFFRRSLGIAVVPVLASSAPPADGGFPGIQPSLVGEVSRSEPAQVFIDARGASAEAVRRLEAHLRRINAGIEARAVARVRDAGNRA